MLWSDHRRVTRPPSPVRMRSPAWSTRFVWAGSQTEAPERLISTEGSISRMILFVGPDPADTGWAAILSGALSRQRKLSRARTSPPTGFRFIGSRDAVSGVTDVLLI